MKLPRFYQRVTAVCLVLTAAGLYAIAGMILAWRADTRWLATASAILAGMVAVNMALLRLGLGEGS